MLHVPLNFFHRENLRVTKFSAIFFIICKNKTFEKSYNKKDFILEISTKYTENINPFIKMANHE